MLSKHIKGMLSSGHLLMYEMNIKLDINDFFDESNALIIQVLTPVEISILFLFRKPQNYVA
ncbi:MAG: hypothetical protein DLM72_16020 [Candidatus Nitrosopolaris wilkensis]|nr:MAG: hypothetical protein DLM72_16020 [Candidatus Nitrosopolaris wilkensis]